MFNGLGFKSPFKRAGKVIQKASNFISTVGATPIKSLRLALIAGDEEKSIAIYTASTKGHSLEEDLHPSMPFPIRGQEDETPLHLAAKSALGIILNLFLDHGGNPNSPNSRDETSIHCICNRSDLNDVRYELLLILLDWKGLQIDGISEQVLVNHVDIDGNAAIHYAASNGLLNCVEALVTHGAIISIVNKDQMTCCEMAVSHGHITLADMLEIALVFQPVDPSMAIYDEEQKFSHENHPPLLLLDSESFPLEQLPEWRESIINRVVERIAQRSSRVECILDAYGWDDNKVTMEWCNNSNNCLKTALLDEQKVLPLHINDNNDNKNIKVNHDNLKHSSYNTSKTAKSSDFFEVQFEDDDATSSGSIDINYSLSTTVDNTSTAMSSAGGVFPSLGSCSICGESFTAPPLHILHVPTLPPSLPAPLPTPLPPPKRSASDDSYMSLLQTQTLPPAPPSLTPPPPLPSQSTATSSQLPPSSDIPELPEDLQTRPLTCGGGHTFCLQCWVRHVQIQVVELECHYLGCPAYRCGERLPQAWSSVLLHHQPELQQRVHERSLRHSVDVNPNMRWCRHADCGSALRIIDHTPTTPTSSSSSSSGNRGDYPPRSAICTSCGYGFCFDCSEDSHSPSTCDQYAKWKKKVKTEMAAVGDTKTGDEDLASAMWVEANTKKCPRCQTHIEKNEGCNHMTCRKCRSEFCWICMQDWSLHSNQTGGFFQCNRFESKSGTASASASSSSNNRDDDLYGTGVDYDRGSAVAEGVRMRINAERMETFLHHFTRHRAHRGSYDMEFKMMRDTIKRVKNELLSTATGSMRWLQGSLAPHPLLAAETSFDAASAITITTPSSSSSSSLPKNNDIPQTLPTSLLPSSVGSEATTVSPSPQPHTLLSKSLPVLAFLENGFIELLKCRQVLKGSYPFAYYTFDEENSNRYRVRRSRQKIEAKKQIFEHFQSDLEMLTEMLSEIVARSRLRASHVQISQATRAARSKRVELENCIVNMFYKNDDSLDDQFLPIRYSGSRSNYSTSASTRNQYRISQEANDRLADINNLMAALEASSRMTPSNAMTRVLQNHIDRNIQSMVDEGRLEGGSLGQDEEEEEDDGLMLVEEEEEDIPESDDQSQSTDLRPATAATATATASRPQPRQRTSPHPRSAATTNRIRNSFGLSRRFTSNSTTATTSPPPPPPATTATSSATARSTSSTSRGTFRRPTINNTTTATATTTTTTPATTAALAARRNENLQAMISEFGYPAASLSPASPANNNVFLQWSPEEEDLNRAILMSIHDAQAQQQQQGSSAMSTGSSSLPNTTTTTTSASATNNGTSITSTPANTHITSDNIQALVSMGFERGLAENALRDTGNDLETAANILLSQL